MAVTRRWIALGLFLGLFAVFSHEAAPSVTAGDAGEFVAAAATLSLPHAPSFPVYVVTGRAFLEAARAGAPGYRASQFSAFCGALAAAVAFLFLESAGAGLAASLALALAGALTAAWWSNSLVTEVFALHALFLAGMTRLLVRANRAETPEDRDRALIAFAFTAGVATGNHQAVIFILPGVLVEFLRPSLPLRRVRVLIAMALFGLAGMSIYLVLPVRAAKEPPLNWGNPTTVHRLYRTFTRQDYGTFQMATGEVPERNLDTAARQTSEYGRGLWRGAPWPLLALAALGAAAGLATGLPMAWSAVLAFFSSGPVFFVLGNLPFTPQSVGITGRFYLTSIVPLLLAGAVAARRWRWPVTAAAALSVVLSVRAYGSDARGRRNDHLVSDYGRAMLRTLPRGAELFLDGGDDAFYSLAAALYADGRRPDVEVHDRGGLVFRNPYGVDFRQLTKEEKEARRQQVERAALAERPVFYGTMRTDILPGVPMIQRGFLLQANGSGAGFSWPLCLIRSCYPPATSDYRTRSLAAYFPYMEGREAADAHSDEAAAFFRRAGLMGTDIEWLGVNLGQAWATFAHDALEAGRLPLAEACYRDWMDFDPSAPGAYNNLGVVYERMGKLDEAAAWYKIAAQRFPTASDPVFNLGVVAWRRGDWNAAAEDFREALRRQPSRADAARYLAQAELHLKAGAQ